MSSDELNTTQGILTSARNHLVQAKVSRDLGDLFECGVRYQKARDRLAMARVRTQPDGCDELRDALSIHEGLDELCWSVVRERAAAEPGAKP
jgi:hypothetical protein